MKRGKEKILQGFICIICNIEEQYAFLCVCMVGEEGQTKSITKVAPKYFFSLQSLERGIPNISIILWQNVFEIQHLRQDN